MLSWIKDLTSAGINSVICLLTPEEIDLYYQGKLLDFYRKHFSFVDHFPWEDFSLCPFKRFKQIIETIEKRVKDNCKVVVHCSGGVGRTGMTLAGWLVYHHKLSPEDAVVEQFYLGRNPLEAALLREDISEDDIYEYLGRLK